MDQNNEIKNNLEAIKKLLILQLFHADVPVDFIAKTAGMSTKTLYKFLPKKTKKEKGGHN